MSDGPTKLELARGRLERAAIRYAMVGRQPAKGDLSKFKRAERALGNAALAYDTASSAACRSALARS